MRSAWFRVNKALAAQRPPHGCSVKCCKVPLLRSDGFFASSHRDVLFDTSSPTAPSQARETGQTKAALQLTKNRMAGVNPKVLLACLADHLWISCSRVYVFASSGLFLLLLFVFFTNFGAVVRKNSIRPPSRREVGAYLLGFLMLRKPKNQSCEH
jgi:hypothetical protein